MFTSVGRVYRNATVNICKMRAPNTQTFTPMSIPGFKYKL